MKNDQKTLNHIHQSTEMGRDGILSILGSTSDPALHSALEQQLTEYEQMMNASARLIRARGKFPRELSTITRLSAQMSATVKTMLDPSPSKIAEMMIQGNTMGMTKSLQHLHSCAPQDPQVKALAEKLLKTEEANIQQMKGFL